MFDGLLIIISLLFINLMFICLLVNKLIVCLIWNLFIDIIVLFIILSNSYSCKSVRKVNDDIKKRPEGLYDYTILSRSLTNLGRLLELV